MVHDIQGYISHPRHRPMILEFAAFSASTAPAASMKFLTQRRKDKRYYLEHFYNYDTILFGIEDTDTLSLPFEVFIRS